MTFQFSSENQHWVAVVSYLSGGWYHIRLHFESCLRICGSTNGAGCNQFWPGLGWKVLLLGPHVPGRWAALPPVTQLPSVTSRDNSQCDNRLCVCRAQTIGIMIFDPLSFVSSSSSVQSQLSQKPLNAIFQLHIKSLINIWLCWLWSQWPLTSYYIIAVHQFFSDVYNLSWAPCELGWA